MWAQHSRYGTSNTKSTTQWVTVCEVYYKLTSGSLRPSINKSAQNVHGKGYDQIANLPYRTPERPGTPALSSAENQKDGNDIHRTNPAQRLSIARHLTCRYQAWVFISRKAAWRKDSYTVAFGSILKGWHFASGDQLLLNPAMSKPSSRIRASNSILCFVLKYV